ncbi:MAG: OmpA family protein [Planctomycetes bacterium]|nr:OmpA family protein [Planctomycetota bacterium]MBI3846831.1 OmpA family protein [Planctomycetota bacterium]
MSRIGKGIAGVAGILAMGFLATGCTEKYTNKINEQDRIIQQLRSENTGLETELNELKTNETVLQRQLDEKNRSASDLTAQLQSARSAPIQKLTANPSVVNIPPNDKERERRELSDELKGTGAEVEERHGDLVVVLPASITFSSGSATLNEGGRKTLDKISKVLHSRYSSRMVSIEGHTDDEPIRKSKFGSNWRLSTERALAVQQYLQEKGNVPPKKLRVVGYGQYQPVASNTKENGKQKNRRVEIVIERA